MASETQSMTEQEDFTPAETLQHVEESVPLRGPLGWELLLKPLASLKVTVILLALGIFLVFIGTLAQTTMGNWQAVDSYFRTYYAWIEFKVFFPPAWFPSMHQNPDQFPIPGGFPFPGGWTIGIAMLINLFAAHSIRFKIQSHGSQTVLGVFVLMLGLAVTWLVIASGSNPEGFQAIPFFEWSSLWNCSLITFGLLGLALACFAIWSDRLKKTARIGLMATTLATWGFISWLYINNYHLDDSAMRILWQLIKATCAAMVLLGGCMLLFKRRGGIVLLHGGIALMMINELLVGMYAVEGQMHIEEGQTVNYAMDIREVELAFVDPSDPKTDDVVVVPESILLSGSKISHPDLPFDLQLEKYYPNSKVRNLKESEETIATSGAGQVILAEETRTGTGTDSASDVDIASAYVTLFDKQSGEKVDTRLFSQHLKPEKLKLGEKDWEVALRFKRDYKPFSIHLIDVDKQDYLGTNTPRDYSSYIQLHDPESGELRKIRIWMNNPLRYAGDTYYQSNYFKDPITGKEMTGLQVVTNFGWMIPYVACMIVVVGLFHQFGMTLIRFLKRRINAGPQTTSTTHDQTEKKKSKSKHLAEHPPQSDWGSIAVPAFVLLIMVSYILPKMQSPETTSDEFDLPRFATLPVIEGGRCKPIDSYARNTLRVLSNRTDYVDTNGNKQPAIRWFLETAAHTEASMNVDIFRIENLEVLGMLGLKERSGFRYTFNDIYEKLPEIEKQAAQARETDPLQQTTFQRKIVELYEKINTYTLLKRSFWIPVINMDNQEQALQELAFVRQENFKLKNLTQPRPLLIPAQSTNAESDEEEITWEAVPIVWQENLLNVVVKQQKENPALKAYEDMMASFASKDVDAFNSALTTYKSAVAKLADDKYEPAKVQFETRFNYAEPFYYASIVNLVAFVFAILAWIGWSKGFGRTATGLILFGLVIHTAALIARIYISGRPPVTNLYSSAVFIGWGGIVAGLIIEFIYRIGVGNIIASSCGFGTLLIAHYLSLDGDTFTVLQAVLDTQFWLATHVVCITLGYTATFVAGLLGLIYVIRGVLTTNFTPAISKEISRMIYGTLCFALFFSFFGTVLGGLWADDSWGRFWGWDPKENGALMIVLWVALVLHARWDKAVGDRGLAVLAIVGNIITAWSWFGVNELGAGLHSYGFTEGVLLALGGFVISQLVAVSLGCLPRQYWVSHRRAA